MIVDHRKEKIQNAITYFLNNTSWYGKKKIYKLLFILDFEHFKLTGKSVTGFDYFALQMGPVPIALDEAIETSNDEITDNFDIEIQTKLVKQKEYKTTFLKPKTEFDRKYFSRREFKLLVDIAERFAMSSGDDMVWFTHRDTEPWYRMWEIERKRFKQIPYEYALSDLDEEEKDYILEIAHERQAFLENYQ